MLCVGGGYDGNFCFLCGLFIVFQPLHVIPAPQSNCICSVNIRSVHNTFLLVDITTFCRNGCNWNHSMFGSFALYGGGEVGEWGQTRHLVRARSHPPLF